jgi:hypothetical protein
VARIELFVGVLLVRAVVLWYAAVGLFGSWVEELNIADGRGPVERSVLFMKYHAGLIERSLALTLSIEQTRRRKNLAFCMVGAARDFDRTGSSWENGGRKDRGSVLRLRKN